MPEQPTVLDQIDRLPAAQKQAVQAWLGTQMFIAKELGLSSETWFQYIDWALKNPFDFTFVFDVIPEADGDAAPATDVKKAAALVGAVTKTKQPGKGGTGNLVGFLRKKDTDLEKK
jgi:hypothetical protein